MKKFKTRVKHPTDTLSTPRAVPHIHLRICVLKRWGNQGRHGTCPPPPRTVQTRSYKPLCILGRVLGDGDQLLWAILNALHTLAHAALLPQAGRIRMFCSAGCSRSTAELLQNLPKFLKLAPNIKPKMHCHCKNCPAECVASHGEEGSLRNPSLTTGRGWRTSPGCSQALCR